MKEETYLILRKVFFWAFALIFIFLSPIVVYYSIGYKFDSTSKKFQRTGIVSIRTIPKGAQIYVNGSRLNEVTPDIIRELLPREYSFELEKEGYYPYHMMIQVRPSLVSELNIVLVPKMKEVERISLDFNVYRFFVRRHFFAEVIIVFTDHGIYSIDSDFKTVRKISSTDLGEALVAGIEDIKESDNQLIFWNQDKIWSVKIPQEPQETEEPAMIYKSEDRIKSVFLGIKERYLVIHDGLKIVALDLRNPQAHFPALEVKSGQSEIFYDTRSEIIYVKDWTRATGSFSLFRIELVPLLREKKQNEKIS